MPFNWKSMPWRLSSRVKKKQNRIIGIWQGKCSKMSEGKVKGPERKESITYLGHWRRSSFDYCREQKGINQGQVRSRTCKWDHWNVILGHVILQSFHSLLWNHGGNMSNMGTSEIVYCLKSLLHKDCSEKTSNLPQTCDVNKEQIFTMLKNWDLKIVCYSN